MEAHVPPFPKVLNCHTCGAQCCKYFALQLDTPENPQDYDDLRWFLAHQKVAIFIEKGEWFLQVNNPCQFLNDQDQCTHYSQRPAICKDYGWDEGGVVDCHGHNTGWDHEAFFASVAELEQYLSQRGLTWKT